MGSPGKWALEAVMNFLEVGCASASLESALIGRRDVASRRSAVYRIHELANSNAKVKVVVIAIIRDEQSQQKLLRERTHRWTNSPLARCSGEAVPPRCIHRPSTLNIWVYRQGGFSFNADSELTKQRD